MDGEGEEKEIADVCKSLDQHPIEDSTSLYRHTMWVGYGHLYGDKNYQNSIIYYEFTHLLEGFLKEEGISAESFHTFNRSKQCLEQIQEKVSGENHEYFFREDFADFIANTLHHQVPRPPDCDLLYRDENGEYMNIDSLAHPDGEDHEHSTTVFRILRGHLDIGKDLPKSCLRAVEEDQDIWDFHEQTCSF